MIRYEVVSLLLYSLFPLFVFPHFSCKTSYFITSWVPYINFAEGGASSAGEWRDRRKDMTINAEDPNLKIMLKSSTRGGGARKGSLRCQGTPRAATGWGGLDGD